MLSRTSSRPPPVIKHIDGAVAAEAEVHAGDEESLAFKLDAVTTHVVSKIVELAAGFQASCGRASVLPLTPCTRARSTAVTPNVPHTPRSAC